MRLSPSRYLDDLPCSMVAVGCASNNVSPDAPQGLYKDGYLPLDSMNKYVRDKLNVRKKDYFKRVERPLLMDLLRENKNKAIICVEGHYLYADGKDYYSFFSNDADKVVCVWWLND